MKKKILIASILAVLMLVSLSTTLASADMKTVHRNSAYQRGWPVVIEDDIVLGPPVLGDLDNDGTLEIILGSGSTFAPDSGKIYAFKYDGTLMNNFPVDLGYRAGGIPSLGDINNDMFLEIIDDVEPSSTDYTKIYALSHLGNNIPGWPIQTNGFYGRSSLSDIDDDSFLDVIVTGWKAGTQNCYVGVYDRYGSNLSGWPTWVSCPEGMQAIGDIDGDGDLEIVVGTCYWYLNDTGGIYVFDHEGILLDGWPVEMGKRFAAPVTLADLDNDGYLEIIAAGQDGFVCVYHHNATLAFSVHTNACLYSEIVTVDLDNDEDLEILVTFIGYGIIAFHHDGSTVDGWPVYFDGVPGGGGGSGNGEPSVVVGDIDGDDEGEILISSITGTKNLINAWNYNGTLVENFPIEIIGGPLNRYANGALALGDLDADGDIEIVFVGYQQSLSQSIYRTDIYVFDLDGQYNAPTMQWPQFHHDAQHTGCYYKPCISNHPPNPPNIDGQASGTAGEEYEYTFNTTDPEEDDISYYVDWGDDTITDWTDFAASGTEITLTHIWQEQGTYLIRAKAKDTFDDESDWSELEIEMPIEVVVSNQQSLERSSSSSDTESSSKSSISQQSSTTSTIISQSSSNR